MPILVGFSEIVPFALRIFLSQVQGLCLFQHSVVLELSLVLALEQPPELLLALALALELSLVLALALELSLELALEQPPEILLVFALELSLSVVLALALAFALEHLYFQFFGQLQEGLLVQVSLVAWANYA